jgi:hypothetical protein
MRQTYRMVRGSGYSRWQAFCAAFFDIEPPDPYEKIIAKTYASLPGPDENNAVPAGQTYRIRFCTGQIPLSAGPDR